MYINAGQHLKMIKEYNISMYRNAGQDLKMIKEYNISMYRNAGQHLKMIKEYNISMYRNAGQHLKMIKEYNISLYRNAGQHPKMIKEYNLSITISHHLFSSLNSVNTNCDKQPCLVTDRPSNETASKSFEVKSIGHSPGDKEILINANMPRFCKTVYNSLSMSLVLFIISRFASKHLERKWIKQS